MIALPLEEAARELGYQTVRVIRELVNAKKVPAVRLTPKGDLRIRRTDLEAYVNSLPPADPRKDDEL